MFCMAGKWRRRAVALVAAASLAVALGTSGCSTFQEKPGHSPFSVSKSKKSRAGKKSSMNPLSGFGSLFKREEPKLAQSPGEFVGLPRPKY